MKLKGPYLGTLSILAASDRSVVGASFLFRTAGILVSILNAGGTAQRRGRVYFDIGINAGNQAVSSFLGDYVSLVQGYQDQTRRPAWQGAMPFLPNSNLFVNVRSSSAGTMNINFLYFELETNDYVLEDLMQFVRSSGFGKLESMREGPGRVYNVAPSNPAAGADISISVPTAAAWKFRHLDATLVTSSQVATRNVAFLFDDGSNLFYRTVNGLNQTASVTQVYELVPGYAIAETVNSNGFRLISPLDVVLPASFRIRSSTGSIQTSDQWQSIALVVEEWIEP
jgi:hypothetical protein